MRLKLWLTGYIMNEDKGTRVIDLGTYTLLYRSGELFVWSQSKSVIDVERHAPHEVKITQAANER